jgi:CO/xanthine dehydrogenase Mo-binding subunit
MGYSTGTYEEVVYDAATGVRLHPNFLDYRIFTLLDSPPVDCHIVTSRMGYGPYGTAGVGEDNTTFGCPMIIPPTPERVLKALGKA